MCAHISFPHSHNLLLQPLVCLRGGLMLTDRSGSENTTAQVFQMRLVFRKTTYGDVKSQYLLKRSRSISVYGSIECY